MTDPAQVQNNELRYYKKDFWSQENLRFDNPHYRLAKSARIVNRLAGGAATDLLDVGCGPAALQALLAGNVRYHGIDIAIQRPGPNLIEGDFLESPIDFRGKRFDIVLAQGFFEYAGTYQSQKFAEISEILAADGKFVVSYVNFGHRDRHLYWPYSNVMPLAQFRASLAQHFLVDRYFPTSHNWRHHEPGRRLVRLAQLPINARIPVISPRLAVEYFFICSRRPG